MANVHEEITRISKAKNDIKNAIEDCGVDVPDTPDTKIDTYANYIRNIPNNIFSNLNVDIKGGGDTFIRSIKQTNGKIEAAVGYIVSSTESGIVPSINNSNNSSITNQDEWVLTSVKGATPTWKRLHPNAFSNDNDNTTYTLSGSLNDNNYNITLTSSNGNATGAEISCMGAATSSSAGTAGLVPAPAANKQTSFLRGDGTWAIPIEIKTLNHSSYSGWTNLNDSDIVVPSISLLSWWNGAWNSSNASNLTYCANGIIIGSNNIGSQSVNHANTSTYTTYLGTSSNNYTKSTLDAALSDKYSSSISRTKNTVLAAPDGKNGSAAFRALVAADLPLHIHSSDQITSLTDYTKVNKSESLTTLDSLNSALGKLEYKANLGEAAYAIVEAANEGDSIDNLKEILEVLEGIKDTETIQAIIGKYLPLDGGTITGTLTINRNASAIHYNNASGTSWGWMGFSNVNTPTVWMSDGTTSYSLYHSGNCNFLSSTNKNLTPAGNEITNAKIGELIGYQAINKSTWAYAYNGYIKTEWGKMELAGSSILSFGTSSAYTQLFISAPSSSRGDGLTNEMMFYNNHGSTYSPGWTRVVTNRNYTEAIGNPFTANAIVLNGKNEDRNLIRINNTDGDINKKNYYGFTLKYLGSGTGDDNSLALFSDNQTNTSQNKSFEIKQSGNIHTRSILPLITDGTLGTPTNRWNYLYSQCGNFSASTVPLYITRTTNYPVISFSGGNSTSTACYGYLGFGGSDNPVFIKSDGNTVYKLWHAGNDGTGSELDADLLDGTHKSGLLTDVSGKNLCEGNNLSITVGGTSRPIKNLHSSYLDSFDIRAGNYLPNDETVYPSKSCISWFSNNGTPDTNWYSGISVKGWTSVNNYNVWQLVGYSGTSTSTNPSYNLYFRHGYGTTWGSWKTILDSSNFESFISGAYLPLSGGTMTGSIITPKDADEGILPHTNNYGQIGSSDKKFYRMFTNSMTANLYLFLDISWITKTTSTTYTSFTHTCSLSGYRNNSIIYLDISATDSSSRSANAGNFNVDIKLTDLHNTSSTKYKIYFITCYLSAKRGSGKTYNSHLNRVRLLDHSGNILAVRDNLGLVLKTDQTAVDMRLGTVIMVNNITTYFPCNSF